MFDVCISYQNDGKFIISLISNHHRRNPSNCNDAFGHDHNYRIWISSISIVAPPILQKILGLDRYEMNIVALLEKTTIWRILYISIPTNICKKTNSFYKTTQYTNNYYHILIIVLIRWYYSFKLFYML